MRRSGVDHTEEHRAPNLSCFSEALSPTAARSRWVTPPPASVSQPKKRVGC